MNDVEHDGRPELIQFSVGPLTVQEMLDSGEIHQPSEMPHLMMEFTAASTGFVSRRYFQFQLDVSALIKYNLEQVWESLINKLYDHLLYDRHGDRMFLNDQDAVDGVFKRLRQWRGQNILGVDIHDLSDPLLLSGSILGFFSFTVFRNPKSPDKRKLPGWYGKATLNGYTYDCMLGIRGPSFANMLQDYRLSEAFEDALAQLIVQRFPMLDFRLKIKLTEVFPSQGDDSHDA